MLAPARLPALLGSAPALRRLLAVVGGALVAVLLLAPSAWATGSPVVTSAPENGGDPAPTWAWSNGGDVSIVTVDCTLTYGSVVVDSRPGCGWSYTADLAGRPTGSYTLTLVGKDGDGVAGAAVSSSMNYTGPAAPVITSSPASPGAGKTVSWSFTFATGSTPVCTVSYGGSVVQTVSGCPTTATFTLGSGDGPYTFAVRSSNSPTTTSAPYVLDSTGPVLTLTGPAGPHASRAPSFALGGGESGASYTCTLRAPDLTSSPVTCQPGTVTLDLQGADGQYRLTAVGRDALGNTGSSVSVDYQLDTRPLAAPTVTGPVGPSNDRRADLQLGTVESDVAWTCTVAGRSGPYTVACSAGTFTYPLETALDGVYTVSVTLTKNGRSSPTVTHDYELDTTLPAAPSVTGDPGPSNSLSPAITIGGEAGATYSCTLTGPGAGGAVTTPGCAAGTASLTLTANDGLWTLVVTQTDAAGNTGPARSWTYRLDTAAPTAPGVTGPAGPSNVTRPQFTLSGEDGGSYACTLTSPTGVVAMPTCAVGTLELVLSGDGDWKLVVTVRDAAGNTSGATTWNYRLDTVVPAAPGVSGPAGPSNATSPRFTLSGEDGGTYSCTLTSPAGVVTTPLCGAGALDLVLSGDGVWTLSVTIRDAAGHVSAATVRTYWLDTSPPDPPTVLGPAGPSNVTRPRFTLSGEDRGTYSCTLTSPTGVITTPLCGEGLLDLVLSGDGLWTLVVTIRDAAGNTSGTTTRTYRLDTAAPAAPGVTGPAGPSNVTRPQFTLSGEDGGTYSCTLTSPTGVITTPLCGEGLLDLVLSGDGLWTLVVTIRDAAGNTSGTTARTYRLDTAAPAAPGVTGPAGPSNVTRPQFTLSGEDGGTYSCSLTSPTGVITTPTCAAGTLELVLSGDGLWALVVTIRDAAGNTSGTTTRTYRLDTAAPAAPGVTGPTGPSNVTRPQFTLSGEDGGTYSCTLTSPTGAVTTPLCGEGLLELVLSGDGLWTLVVTIRDAAGNTSGTTTRTYRLDTAAPTAPGVTGPAGPSNVTRPQFTLSGEDGGTYSCSLTSPTGVITTPLCGEGLLDLVLSGDGLWTLVVTVRDAAGNTSGTTTRTYRLDTAAPSAPGVSGPTGPSNVTRPQFTLSGEDGGTYSCTLTSPTGVITTPTCGEGLLDVVLSGDGLWTLVVTVTDAGGNASSSTEHSYLLDTSAPSAPGVSGPTGPSNLSRPPFTLSGEDGGTYSCTLTSPRGAVTTLSCSAGALELALSGDGLWTLVVTVRDAAGNLSGTTTRTYLLDTSAPSAPGVSGPTGPSNLSRPPFTLSGEDGGTYSCTLTSPTGAVTTPSCSAGTLELALSGDGLWTLVVTVRDAAGNLSGTTTRTYLLDTAAPAAPLVTGPAGPTADRRAVVQLDGDRGSRWSCELRGPDGSRAPVPCGPGDLGIDLDGPDGVWELVVTLVDPAGNASSPTSYRLLLDTTPPAAPEVRTVPTRDGSWSLETEDGARLTCTLVAPDGRRTDIDCAPGVLSVELERLTPGTWLLVVRAVDRAGTVGEATTTVLIVPSPVPDPEPADDDAGPTAGPAPEEVTASAAPRFAATVQQIAVTALPDAVEAVVRLALADGAATRALQRLRAPGGLDSRWRDILRVVGTAATVGGVPLVLLLLVMLFLALQDRIDRNDPKLALAPVHSHQELPFRPVERGGRS